MSIPAAPRKRHQRIIYAETYVEMSIHHLDEQRSTDLMVL